MLKKSVIVFLALTSALANGAEELDSVALPNLLFQATEASGRLQRNGNIFEIVNYADSSDSKSPYVPKQEKSLENLNAEVINYENISLIMLSKIFPSNVISKEKIKLPFIFYEKKSKEQFKLSDGFYKEGACKGLGFFEAKYKDKCINSGYEPLFEASTDLLINKNLLNYYLYRSLPRLFGFRSYASSEGFSEVLSPVDKHLYSSELKRSIKEQEPFAEIFPKCKNPDCRIFEFKSESLEHLKYANNKDNAEANLPLYTIINKDGSCEFKLRNTLLSDSDFVNYDFYSEIELAALQDLGFDIIPQIYYGSSIYSSGSRAQIQKIVLNKGYFSWDDILKIYDEEKISSIPLSIGTHIYGNYNEVRQQASIASVGYGSTGVRIDGAGNSFILPKQSVIIENGINSTGIAVNYGSNSKLDIDGFVSANRRGGIAVALDFKENMRSDDYEYQGSFVRVRIDDYNNKELSREKAAALEVPEELKGPLVSVMNVSGTLIGKQAAIYIGDTAWVREINFSDRATIKGDIISDYSPYIDGEWIYLAKKDQDLLPARFQLKPRSNFLDYKGNKSFFEKLSTNLNFGGTDYISLDKDVKDHPNRADTKALIDINGDIKGRDLMLNVLGGVTLVKGRIEVKSLTISKSSLHLSSKDKDEHTVDFLYLDNGAALNLADGRSNIINVNKNAFIAQNSVIKVDTDEDGNILDKIVVKRSLATNTGQIHIEPCVSYAQLKQFNADPKALLNYVSKFVANANTILAPYKISAYFPTYLWHKSGIMGRKIKCTARGCRIGDFVGSRKDMFYDKLPLWRIYLSLGGCVALAFATVLFRHKIKGPTRKNIL